ncbi:MAG: LLM class flavin-dependent oxidoreductase [Aigarchaeota archaeon]|nr:LLM class flavin-dependent oxidoreductase [Candidatus Pelearchaeum maunauluense]
MKFSVAFEAEEPHLYFEPIRLARLGGLWSVQIYEHLPYSPAWPMVFHIASTCDAIRLGPVTVPVFLYSPEQLSRYVRLLLKIATRGVVLGISRGAFAETLGYKVDRSRERVVLFIRRLGELLKDILAENRLVIYVGTSGPKLAYEAASIPYVNGIVVDSLWNEKYAEKMRKIIDESCIEAGRDPREVELVARPYMVIDNDIALAGEISKHILKIVGKSKLLEEAGIADKKPGEFSSMEQFKRVYGKLIACGDRGTLLEGSKALGRAGVNHIVFGIPRMRMASRYVTEVVSLAASW